MEWEISTCWNVPKWEISTRWNMPEWKISTGWNIPNCWHIYKYRNVHRLSMECLSELQMFSWDAQCVFGIWQCWRALYFVPKLNIQTGMWCDLILKMPLLEENDERAYERDGDFDFAGLLVLDLKNEIFFRLSFYPWVVNKK